VWGVIIAFSWLLLLCYIQDIGSPELVFEYLFTGYKFTHIHALVSIKSYCMCNNYTSYSLCKTRVRWMHYTSRWNIGWISINQTPWGGAIFRHSLLLSGNWAKLVSVPFYQSFWQPVLLVL